MEVNVIKNRLIVTHKLKPNETYRLDKRKKYSSITIFKAPKLVMGVSSRTEDGKDILMLDYDSCDLDLVKSDYKIIQKEFNLLSGYIFTTKIEKKFEKTIGNFHIINLQKFLPKEIVKIQSHCHIDSNYADSPTRNPFKSWVLRIGAKGKRERPEYMGLIGEISPIDNEISSAHKELLSKLYPSLKHPRYLKDDKMKGVSLQEYETLN